MPSAKFEYASAKIKIVKISAIEVRGMIEAGRCVSCAACEIDSKPTNEMIASDVPSISWYGVGQWICMVWISSPGPKRKQEAQAENERFAEHVERRNDAVECGAFAHADHVEHAEPDDQREHDDEMQPRMRRS